MRLKELLPLIECSNVNVYEKGKYRLSTFIATMNPKKNKGYIADELLNREFDSILIGCNQSFRVFVRDEEIEELKVKILKDSLVSIEDKYTDLAQRIDYREKEIHRMEYFVNELKWALGERK